MTRCINAILSRRRVIETSRFRRRRDVVGFGGVPAVVFLCRRGAINYVFPVVTYGMDFLVIFRPRFAFFLGAFMDSCLHRFPLLFRDLEFLDVVRIPYIAIDDDILHGGSAMRFEWHIVHSAHLTFLLVVRAGATTLRAALT